MQTPTERRARGDARLSPWAFGLAVAAMALGTDVASKDWALQALAEPVAVTPWFYLALYGNAGIYLGAMPVANIWMLYWSVMAMAAVWLGLRIVRSSDRTVNAGYALVAGGLAGNALCLLSRGAVVDFLAFGPVTGDKWLFVNLADLFLVAGGLVLGAVLVRGRLSRLLAPL